MKIQGMKILIFLLKPAVNTTTNCLAMLMYACKLPAEIINQAIFEKVKGTGFNQVVIELGIYSWQLMITDVFIVNMKVIARIF